MLGASPQRLQSRVAAAPVIRHALVRPVLVGARWRRHLDGRCLVILTRRPFGLADGVSSSRKKMLIERGIMRLCFAHATCGTARSDGHGEVCGTDALEWRPREVDRRSATRSSGTRDPEDLAQAKNDFRQLDVGPIPRSGASGFRRCDLSPNFHPAGSRIRSSFGPVRSGVATGRGAKPSGMRSAPACCGTEALRAA